MAIDILLRPCKTCGGTDRYENGGKCKACARARASAHQKKNSEATKEYMRQWRLANIDEVRKNDRERSALFRKEHPGRRRDVNRSYRERNAEKVASSRRAWKEANPSRVREYASTRRAHMRGTGGRLQKGTVKMLLEKQKMKCACCKTSIKNGYHVDHIIPLAKGGSHQARNIQLLCPNCNLSKGAKHPIDFMQERGMLL